MMNQKNIKRIIREYLREHYSDEQLAALLAHARDGKLSYMSCCCFVGFPYAGHTYRTENEGVPSSHKAWPFAEHLPPADFAYAMIAGSHGDDNERRRRLIPIIRAEMKRREIQRASDIRDSAVTDAQAYPES